MNAKDKKTLAARQAAQSEFIERLDGMRDCHQRRLSVPDREGVAGTLGEMIDKQERKLAGEKVISLTHAIHELRDLAV